MNTIRTASAEDAAQFIRDGKIVAFPTETVYGLGADAFQPAAVEQIFEAKGRPADNPLIVHLAERRHLRQVVSAVPPMAEALLDAFTPGPLTLILPKHPDVPAVVTAGLDTVGVRIPSHETAQAFLRACDTPVAAPSANRSGRPSPTTWQAVEEDLSGRIHCILKGERTEAGLESTVLDCTQEPPTVLRPGSVSVEHIRTVIGRVESDDAPPLDGEPVRSPGTRHRHYAPSAHVRLIDDPSEAETSSAAGYIGLDAPEAPDRFTRIRVVPDLDTYAHDLFEFFRACDRDGCSVIYAQRVPREGLGRALQDRLDRAAAR